MEEVGTCVDTGFTNIDVDRTSLRGEEGAEEGPAARTLLLIDEPRTGFFFGEVGGAG